MPEWTFGYNCYEIGHTWTPHCTDAALDMSSVVVQQALPMYAGLYLLSHCMSARSVQKLMDKDTIKETVISVFRSSAFLGFNTFAMIIAFCMLRKITGRFYYTLCATLPAFVGSVISIPIERKNRRAGLAFYVANVASECLFNIGVARGYIPSLPHGDVVLFTFSMTILLYLIKKKGFGHDPVSLVVKFLIGTSEAKKVPAKDSDSICSHSSDCYMYVGRGFGKAFAAGWLVQSGLMTLPKIRHLNGVPSAFLTNLYSRQSMKFGLFLGSFCAIYKGISCYLRQRQKVTEDWHCVVAALAAGPTMLWSPNYTVTLYLTWKMIESMFFIGVDNGWISHPFAILHCLYAAGVGLIFYTGVLEPSMLRGSYAKFIDRVTDHRLHLMNRNLLDVFGTGASIGYEDYFPDLVPKLCSHSFMETVFLWMI